jgi:hypothetical protein
MSSPKITRIFGLSALARAALAVFELGFVDAFGFLLLERVAMGAPFWAKEARDPDELPPLATIEQ